jgi:DNA-binding CsgD family transcriptional regulator
VETINALVLSLYAATSESDPADFMQRTMVLMQTALRFDSAGYSTLDTGSGHTLVLGGDTFREVPTLMTQWQKANHADPVLARCLAHPGSATAFHAPSLTKSLRDRDIQAYLGHNKHHQNGIAIIFPGDLPGHWHAAGFYRSEADHHFSQQDSQLVELLAPHFLQAVKINRRMAYPVQTTCAAASAIVDSTGHVQFAGNGFLELARTEWSGWRSDKLPVALMRALKQSDAMVYKGDRVEVTGRASGEMIVLQIKPLSALEALSPREAFAARLFGAGMSTKEIAQEMNISPHTARNFIQRVYKKLDLNDKASLAVALTAQTRKR